MASQNLIVSQIPWASSQASRFRSRTHPDKDEESSQREVASASPSPDHRAEELLAALLAANQELADVIRIYEDLRRLAEETALEREAEERSKIETRLDRSVSLDFCDVSFY